MFATAAEFKVFNYVRMWINVVYSEAKEEPRRTSSFFFSKQPTPAKPSKVKEM